MKGVKCVSQFPDPTATDEDKRRPKQHKNSIV